VRYADEARAAAAYFYDGSTDGSGVLKNKRDIRDARSLELTERAMVTAQAKNLPASIDLFSYNGLQRTPPASISVNCTNGLGESGITLRDEAEPRLPGPNTSAAGWKSSFSVSMRSTRYV
jgi:hypothetical protein